MVLADTSKGDIGWKKWLVAGWAFMECLLFAGIMFGWPSLNFVLKSEGIYADLCEDTANSSFLTYYMENNTATVLNIRLLNGTTSSSNKVFKALSNMSSQYTKEEACKPQDDKMAFCFTIGTVVYCIGCAVFGFINYRFGTMVTRLICMVFFITGTLMMAFTSKENPWLMFPGLSLIGTGGMPILVTNVQVSNLFSKGSSAYVGLLCGGFDMSSAVMLLVKIAYENGFSRMNMFIIITVMHCLLFVSTFCFLPKDFITKPGVKQDTGIENEVGIKLLKINNQTAVQQHTVDEKFEDGGAEKEPLAQHNEIAEPAVQRDSVSESTGDGEAGKEPLKQTVVAFTSLLNFSSWKEILKLVNLIIISDESTESPSLLSCLKQGKFVTHTIWLCILQLRFFYILGTLNRHLNILLEEDEEEVSSFTNISLFIMMGGLLTSPFAGWVYDWVKTVFKDGNSQMYREIIPAVLPLALASALSVILSILVLIPVTEVLYLTFIVMTVYRSFLYSTAAGFLSAVFPSEYFGLLFGIMILFGGIFGLLQYLLFFWAEQYSDAPFHVSIVFSSSRFDDG
ncbi:equilibrative nucleobase transporter 1-like [Ruditapes philippinarum]|uniref:equilibrative nucleobase transporter 1-like n=1 Tax=Ruditapes philippinarum TaxID=129788 RepID=UPI00295BB1D7|nr:equilibrative nucleobase transporter 1-like [Ruditapes philippinarum]